jgi:hypothetical protein
LGHSVRFIDVILVCLRYADQHVAKTEAVVRMARCLGEERLQSKPEPRREGTHESPSARDQFAEVAACLALFMSNLGLSVEVADLDAESDAQRVM